MKSVHDVIIRPVLTEKAYDGFADKKYVFEVAINATKTEIKQAVETIFDGVKVESVNTINRLGKVNTLRTIGKIKRQGRSEGRTPEVKKAYVTLKKDSKPIKFFEGMGE